MFPFCSTLELPLRGSSRKLDVSVENPAGAVEIDYAYVDIKPSDIAIARRSC